MAISFFYITFFRVLENMEYLTDQMEELKYESEDLYSADEPSSSNSTHEAER